MRIGILSQWYDPEPGSCRVPGVLARGLVARGHKVRVLTGFPNAPTGEVQPPYRGQQHQRSIESLHGVHITRVPLYPYHGAKGGRRLANYASFAASAVALGLPQMRDLDVLWVYNSPVTVAGPMWLLRYGAGVPYVLHNMDMWPDSVQAAGFLPRGGLGKAAWSALESWCNRMYQGADSVAYISPSAGAELQRRGVPASKLHYVPIWTDEALYYPREANEGLRRAEGLDDSDVLMLYAGVLGHAQDVANIARLVADQPPESPLRFWILGEGHQSEEIAAIAESSRGRVRYFGWKANEAVPEYYAAADIQLVALGQSAISSFSMPSKVPAILASGKPLLVWGDGDAAALVADQSVGIGVNESSGDSLASGLAKVSTMSRGELAAMGIGARALYERDFAAASAINRVESLLTDAHRRRER